MRNNRTVKTFGTNIRDLLDYVYGDIEISSNEIKKLKNALKVNGTHEDKFKHLKAINSLFKNLTFQLLTELNTLEREMGGKLRKQQPTGLNLSDKVRMDSNDIITLYKDNLLIGVNNLKLKKIIDKMKESVDENKTSTNDEL